MQKLKIFQPSGGAIRHMIIWLTSGCGDLSYKRKLTNSDTQWEPNDDDIAIYCIHGTADRRNSFLLLVKQLVDKLPDKISSIHLISFEHRGQGKSITFFAEQLTNKIKKNGHQNVIVMGHSRGGLIAGYFAENLAEKNGIHVFGVVNICSPYDGASLASSLLAGISSSINEMKVNSNFLINLREKVKISNKKYLYIAATNDHLVKLNQTCIQEHIQYRKVIDMHGHLSIMSSKRLAEHIEAFINAIVTEQNTNALSHTNLTKS